MIGGRSILTRTTSISFTIYQRSKEKEFSNLLDLSSLEKLTQSLFATMKLFDCEAQEMAKKMGFDYDKEEAEKMIFYAEERFGL